MPGLMSPRRATDKPRAVKGCTGPGCRRMDTVTVDVVHGRRCPTCPPTFDPTHCVELARYSGMPAALGYLRSSLPQES